MCIYIYIYIYIPTVDGWAGVCVWSYVSMVMGMHACVCVYLNQGEDINPNSTGLVGSIGRQRHNRIVTRTQIRLQVLKRRS